MANLISANVKSNKLMAEIYIVNMIVGSYFAKDNMNHPLVKSEAIDYFLMKSQNQEKAEATVIYHMEKLPKAVLSSIEKLNYSMHAMKENSKIFLLFATGSTNILVILSETGDFLQLEALAPEALDTRIKEIKEKAADKAA